MSENSFVLELAKRVYSMRSEFSLPVVSSLSSISKPLQQILPNELKPLAPTVYPVVLVGNYFRHLRMRSNNVNTKVMISTVLSTTSSALLAILYHRKVSRHEPAVNLDSVKLCWLEPCTAIVYRAAGFIPGQVFHFSQLFLLRSQIDNYEFAFVEFYEYKYKISI